LILSLKSWIIVHDGAPSTSFQVITKLGGVDDASDSYAAIQRDLDRVEK